MFPSNLADPITSFWESLSSQKTVERDSKQKKHGLQNQETDTEDSSRRDEGRSAEGSLVTVKQWSEDDRSSGRDQQESSVGLQASDEERWPSRPGEGEGPRLQSQGISNGPLFLLRLL